MSATSPVFICGYPKSGTTLLLALLDRHPDLLVFPEESKFLPKVLGYPERQNFDYLYTETGANAFRYDEIQWASGYRDYSDIDFDAYRAAVKRVWEDGKQGPAGLLESIVLGYGQVTEQAPRRFWVEKTPLNELYLEQAVDLWPDLRTIYILRDPRDNYCSYFKKRKTDQVDFSLVEFTSQWHRSLSAWEDFAARHGRNLLVRYRDLVTDPDAALKEICAFLGIAWDDILTQPTRNGVHWSGNSMDGTEFSGISSASLGKYKDQLSAKELKIIEAALSAKMQQYGLEVHYPASKIPAGFNLSAAYLRFWLRKARKKMRD